MILNRVFDINAAEVSVTKIIVIDISNPKTYNRKLAKTDRNTGFVKF